MVRSQTVLDSWRTVREETALAVEEFPGAEMNFKPAPELASFREIARHILDAGHALTGLLLAGEEDLTGPQFREKLKPYLSALPPEAGGPELAAALRRAAEERAPELGARSAEWWAHVITRFDGQQVTRLELMQFVKEHELTHRAQLFLYGRMKGIVPVTTRRRAARQAGK